MARYQARSVAGIREQRSHTGRSFLMSGTRLANAADVIRRCYGPSVRCYGPRRVLRCVRTTEGTGTAGTDTQCEAMRGADKAYGATNRA
eukprot:3674051-Rhodomonas_salina.3